MIDSQEWANWIGKGELPSTISLPWNGADAGVSQTVQSGFETLNRAFKHYAAISKETRLSPGERARAFAETQKFINGELSHAVSAATGAQRALSERAARERESFTRGSISDDMALGLAMQVRTLGKGVISSDPRFMQAINRVPAAVAGLDDDQVKMFTDDVIQRHNPNLAQLIHSVGQAAGGVDRLEKVAYHLAAQVDQSIDRKALAQDTEFRGLLG